MYLPLADEIVKEASCQHQTASHVFVVNFKEVLIFVTHGERTGRTGRHNGFIVVLDRLPHGVHISLSLPLCLFGETVGNKCNAATFLLFKQMNAVSAVLAELWIVVVDIATVEVTHKL